VSEVLPFPPSVCALLAQAEAVCERRGVRLTALRRQVLGLVLDSPTPAGAYDLLERLRAGHKGAAPPTIYRALDFLLEQGLIHKLERLSAFVGCVHAPHMDEHAGGSRREHGAEAAHAAQFLICRDCGRVTELSDPAIAQAVRRAAGARGFALAASTVEADGTCADCAAPGVSRPAPS
jgi:Fur family zinc uptake transcriptional regulator